MSAVLIALLVGLFAGDAFAKPWGYDLGSELMSPYCPGRTVSSCPSPQAAELVQWIVSQEAAGSTREEVLAILIERFGEEILAAPPAKGVNLWIYILPILGFVVGGGLAAYALRRIVAGGGGGGRGIVPGDGASIGSDPPADVGVIFSQADTASPIDEALARRVDADLAARS